MEENTQQSQKMPPYPPPYRNPRRRKTNWWIPLLVIGVIVVLIFVFFAVLASNLGSAFEKEKIEVTSNSVLYLTLDNIEEYTKQNPLSIFSNTTSNASFHETLRAIGEAKNDDNIKGIYIKQGLGSLGFSKSVEIQSALDDFKESGKFIYAFAEYGDESMYFNMLPADSIFAPGEGIFELNGLSASSIFLKGFFDKIGVDYTVIHFEDFKSAGDMYSETKFSDSAKYQLRVLLQQRYDIIVNAISKYRNIPKENIIDAMNRGLYTTDSLLAEGFIDGFATESNVKDFIRYRANGEEYNLQLSVDGNSKENLANTEFKGKLNLISVANYVSTLKADSDDVFDKDIQIAIINGVGAISSGFDNEGGWGSNEYAIHSGEFVKNLRKARNDDKIKAIILRIDSPGGSVLASEEIWDEIIRAKSVKPVYASMSDVAASGGYYMAMACDTIIAHPTTITGSIGVILAIPNVSGTMAKLGITADTINLGSSSQLLNTMLPFDKNTYNKLYEVSGNMYKRFITRAAESRNMSFDELHSLAKGRVWTGEDAKARGLVDVLGGLETTIDIVKNRLGVPLDKKVYVRNFPEKIDEVQAILNMFGLGDKREDDEFGGKAQLADLLGLNAEEFIINWNAIPKDAKSQLRYMLELNKISQKEQAMVAMPYLIDFK